MIKKSDTLTIVATCSFALRGADVSHGTGRPDHAQCSKLNSDTRRLQVCPKPWSGLDLHVQGIYASAKQANVKLTPGQSPVLQ